MTAMDKKAVRYTLQTFSFEGWRKLRLAWNSGWGEDELCSSKHWDYRHAALQLVPTVPGQVPRASYMPGKHSANSATFLALQIHLEFLAM